MKKVLMLSYIFPPLGGPAVQRTLKYVKYLRGFGWEPIVVTVGQTWYSLRDASLMTDIPEGIKIIRIDDKAIVNKQIIEEIMSIYNEIIKDQQLIKEFLIEMKKSQKLNLVPTNWIFWANEAIKKLVIKKDLKNIDLIYTTSDPYSDHIIGYYLKKSFSKPWVADFRDEWTNHSDYKYVGHRYQMDYALEKSFVEYADKVITVSPMITSNYRDLFDLESNKVVTLTNGYDEADFTDIKETKEKRKYFTAGYNGRLGGAINPMTFLKALNNLISRGKLERDKFRVYFTVDENKSPWVDYVYQSGLQDIVEFTGYLSHKKSLIKASKSNILLLFIGAGKDRKSIYPGKVFEYLRLNKPILALSPKGSVVDQLLQELKRGVNVDFNDIENIEKVILKFYQMWDKGNQENLTVTDKIKKYERKNLTKKLVKEFNLLTVEKNIEDKTNKKLKIAFFIPVNADLFVNDIIKSLSCKYMTKKIIVSDYTQINKGMEWADICWFEWCENLIIYGSKLAIASEKIIICRLHSYEAFTKNIFVVNWERVDKVIFIAKHIKDFVLENINNLRQEQLVIIPNGVKVTDYSYQNRSKDFKIAFVANINFKKGPLLLLNVFKSIYERDRRYKLYIAGRFQEARYLLYYQQMIREMGLENNVFYDGWQENINEWLEDKNYIISTSVLESQQLSIMEAMAKGIKPLVHNFVGAKNIYEEKYIWSSLEDLFEMLRSQEYNSEEYRKFVQKKYLFRDRLEDVEKLIIHQARKNINKSDFTKRNLIVTGIPKSGTTLLSALISTFANTICLDEIFYDINSLSHNLAGIRKRLIVKEEIPNRYNKGTQLSTNMRGEKREKRLEVIDKKFNKKAIVGTKVNVPYLFKLNKLINYGYKMIAIVRDPIYTIASWRSWQTQKKQLVNEARVKVGEVDKRYKDFPFKSRKTVERQAEVWQYLASIIWKYRHQIKIYTYEKLTENTEEVIKDICDYLGTEIDDIPQIESLNIDERYTDLNKIEKAVKAYAPIRTKFGYE